MIHGTRNHREMGMKRKNNHNEIIIMLTEMGVHDGKAEIVINVEIIEVAEAEMIAEGVAVNSSHGTTIEEGKIRGTKNRERPSIRTRETMIAT